MNTDYGSGVEGSNPSGRANLINKLQLADPAFLCWGSVRGSVSNTTTVRAGTLRVALRKATRNAVVHLEATWLTTPSHRANRGSNPRGDASFSAISG